MIQNVLRHMGGIENYGIISLILFVACFAGMLVWVCLLRKPFLKKMSELPLQTENTNSTKTPDDHE